MRPIAERVSFLVPSQGNQRQQRRTMLGYWSERYFATTYCVAFNQKTNGACCAEIAVHTDEDAAKTVAEVELRSFDRYPKCTDPELQEGQARYMLKVALARGILGGVEKGLFTPAFDRQRRGSPVARPFRVVLNDVSNRDVTSTVTGAVLEVGLADVEMLLRGQTWYQRVFGAEPASERIKRVVEDLGHHRRETLPQPFPEAALTSLHDRGGLMLSELRVLSQAMSGYNVDAGVATWGDLYERVVAHPSLGYPMVSRLIRHALALSGHAPLSTLRHTEWVIPVDAATLRRWSDEASVDVAAGGPTAPTSGGGRRTRISVSLKNSVDAERRRVVQARRGPSCTRCR